MCVLEQWLQSEEYRMNSLIQDSQDGWIRTERKTSLFIPFVSHGSGAGTARRSSEESVRRLAALAAQTALTLGTSTGSESVRWNKFSESGWNLETGKTCFSCDP